MREPAKVVASNGRVSYKVRFRTTQGRQSSRSFATRQAALVFARDMDSRGVAYALDMQREETQATEGVQLDELAEAHFARVARQVRSDRTVADYRRDWRNWVSPTFGARVASTITANEVQDWVDAMHTGRLGRRPAAPKSIADRHFLLAAVFEHAVRKKVVAESPASGTQLPKRIQGQPRGLRPAEWQALRAALAQIDTHACDLADFLLASGWRWSEAVALSMYEVEDDGLTMHVNMARVARRNAAGQHLMVEDGKSTGSLRRTRLDPFAAEIVRRRVASATGPAWLVFTTGTGAPWHYNNFRSRKWEKAVDVAQLTRRPTPHWLRHTHVAWLLMTSGVGLAEIQARVGHKSISTTVGVYGRMVNDVRPEALDAFAAMRSRTPGGADDILQESF